MDRTVLAIETAGSRCSAAVACEAEIIAAESLPLRYGHAEVVLPMIDRVMAAAGLPPTALAAVAVATGPGGFTGIRVGLAAAHGIALASGARLLGISSFTAVAAALAGRCAGEKLLVALDSRRDDLYVQLFASDLSTPLAAPAALLPDRLAGFVAGLAGDDALLVAGDAADAAAAALGARPNLTIAVDSAPDASAVALAAWRQLRRGIIPPPARPLYLRPPDVTLPAERR